MPTSSTAPVRRRKLDDEALPRAMARPTRNNIQASHQKQEDSGRRRKVAQESLAIETAIR
jgi:hypothetical protein